MIFYIAELYLRNHEGESHRDTYQHTLRDEIECHKSVYLDDEVFLPHHQNSRDYEVVLHSELPIGVPHTPELLMGSLLVTHPIRHNE